MSKRKVFANSMVAHVWAQQTQEEGRSGNGNFFFEGRTIYSYGYHFPVATMLPDGNVIMNNGSYSQSTQRHISYVRRAINVRPIYADKSVMDYFRSGPLENVLIRGGILHKGALAAMEKATARLVRTSLNSAAKRVKESKRLDDIGGAIAEIDNCERFFHALGEIRMPKKLAAMRENLRGDTTVILAQHAAAIEAENKAAARKEKQRERERQKEIAESIENFRSGERFNQHMIPRDNVLLRINGENVETSQGAVFPIKHAVKAFKAIKAHKEAGTEWHTNGKTIPLGLFKLDSIQADGTVRAGCHTVRYAEIEALAKQLKLI